MDFRNLFQFHLRKDDLSYGWEYLGKSLLNKHRPNQFVYFKIFDNRKPGTHV